jgi:hypothetical protein
MFDKGVRFPIGKSVKLATTVSFLSTLIGVIGITLGAVSSHFNLGDGRNFFLFNRFGLTRADVIFISAVGFVFAFCIELFVVRRKILVDCKRALLDVLLMSQPFLFVAVFVLSLGVRLFIVWQAPPAMTSIDLTLYVSVGQLVTKGIDPYNYSDGIEEREKLRLENPIEFKRDEWNYYVSGNFPATTLYLGLIDKIHFGEIHLFHRLCYAIVDSFAALAIFVVCWRYWPRTPSDDLPSAVGSAGAPERRLYVAMLLGPVCPLFILWGTVTPEDKGMQTLLMAGALLCLLAAGNKLIDAVGVILLGLSIAFKALGVFLLPVYFSILNQRGNSKIPGIVAIAIAFLVVIATFVPFDLHFIDVMLGRLYSNSIPGEAAHQSPWVVVDTILPPIYSSALRYLWVGIWSAMLSGAYLFRRLDLFALCGNALFVFAVIFMSSGALDRMGIAILVSILMIGVQNPTDGSRLAIAQALIFCPLWIVKALNIAWQTTDFLCASATALFVLYYTFVVSNRLTINWQNRSPSECMPLAGFPVRR